MSPGRRFLDPLDECAGFGRKGAVWFEAQVLFKLDQRIGGAGDTKE
jgi:hypothetical protein